MSHALAPRDDLDRRIDALLSGPQYALGATEKRAVLLPILCEQCRRMAESCLEYGRFLDRLGRPPDSWHDLADIPPLPVAMFKRFLLRAVPEETIVRELLSSATTSQQPSRIPLDKATAFRQSRAAVSILKDHIGSRRRPLLVLDAPEATAAGARLGARGAAIRAVGNFASETVYALRPAAEGRFEPDWDAIDRFFGAHAGAPVLVFGMTFIVWTGFVLPAERRGVRFGAAEATLLHSGGWKKLSAEAVSKDEFNRRAAGVLGCPTARILDFYGMVEQVGTIFVDCPAGNKHPPAFAEVILRRAGSLEPVEVGQTGLVEVLSILPGSYPGQAILTEDLAELRGIDDCPCGRLGTSFRFAGRIERAEPRGCGDVLGGAKSAKA